MGAYSKSEILQSSRKREKNVKVVKNLVGLIVVILLVGSFIAVLNLDFLCITGFRLAGHTSEDLNKLKAAIDQQLSGKILGLVPRNNVFFFSSSRLEKFLADRFPGLAKIEIVSPDLNTLKINVTDRDAKIIWCSDQEAKISCYYLSDEGKVYATAPRFSKAVVLEFYSKADLPDIGKIVIDPLSLRRVVTFSDWLKEILTTWPSKNFVYRLNKIDVLPQHDFAAVITKSNGGASSTWRLFFSADQPSDQLITNFNSLTKSPALIDDWQKSGKNLDYLDLRFGDKVFYRFR